MVEPAYHSIRPADLPAPPQAAIEIMRASTQSNVTKRELGRIVKNDTVLSAELLRIANSPFFGLAREVSNISHAVSILGLKALRNLVLCISVRDALGKQQLAGFNSVEFWEDALRRAVSAKLLAGFCTVEPDDCFTMGLLQDFGLLLLFHVNPLQADKWSKLRLLNSDQRIKQEFEFFHSTHYQVMLMLGKTWCLPTEFVMALGSHHNYDDSSLDVQTKIRCRLLYCGNWLTNIYATNGSDDILELACHKITEVMALTEAQIEQCLSELPHAVQEAAGALGFRVATQVNFEQLIRQANVKLAEDNIGFQELTWRLNNALKERDRYAEQLIQELSVAQEMQQKLLPLYQIKNAPVYGVNKAAKILSGDFYDYIKRPDGLIYFNLADVSGKGITAALLMTKACTLFRCLIKQEVSLKDSIHKLNNEICETVTRGMFVTLLAGCYDPETDKVNLINAGHIPVLIRKIDGTFIEISAQSVPIGILPDTEFREVSFTLGHNAMYAFTDGITEAKLDNGKMFGMDRLKIFLNSFARIPANERLNNIINSIAQKVAIVHDDMTMLLLDSK